MLQTMLKCKNDRIDAILSEFVYRINMKRRKKMTGINFVYFMILKLTYHFGQAEQNGRWVFNALHGPKNDLPKFHAKTFYC